MNRLLRVPVLLFSAFLLLLTWGSFAPNQANLTESAYPIGSARDRIWHTGFITFSIT
jgi:hypothetical protein